MISTNQFKNGVSIIVDGDLYIIVEFQHVKPGKGGAFVRTRLKNMRSGNTIERNFRAGEKFEEAFIESKKLQFSYRSANSYHFMDQETFDEIIWDEDQLADIKDFLKENMVITASLYNKKIIDLSLPMFVELQVVEAEPGIKGDTAKATLKPVKLETGATVFVPLFVEVGNTIKIDTRRKEYVGRV